MSTVGADDRRVLLALARAAVEAAVREDEPPPLPARLSPRLAERAGAFVSLYVEGDLRGCIGYVEPRWPLAETVARAAASATHDRRFVPLTPADLGALDLELSILSPPAPIDAAHVDVGVHGLLLEAGGRSGLLLPQVPLAYGWDREVFLQNLCRKAGLPGESWQRADARLYAFTADVFGDRRDASEDTV